ncbi:MAG: hypothetical protein A3J62_01615 [Candidatus Buchananbacteria bacterium RIFCSPHIGHO2_02_FULL_38_8]|uniref:Amino acid transporter transmembrane domain-containing protein n=2 Tax=Candidatus Buchananiibacteriota TaxID=1817903 RepID=A0A1G1XWJ7_9BACT|nr:hypothetical protein [uncultured bacterium]OGY44341.1 MAG: hypothetical protein A2731_00010 [Candidatus Buchananbacteria bacterium RIFCSPHIGHO2_01_FULL_39_8]OGY46795.1 MAG: hypothetical protein A3J62_01615 [Candidatus Buchananbacteria bacterium RIFCSPHIGHO2_02_FULL_38_8]
MYKQLLALSTFTGTIIGVGLFGLPYVTSRIGFIPMIFYFLILTFIMIIIHLMYGEITLRTVENHRLPGYCKIYLNRSMEILTTITTFIGLTGSLLAYIIVGGEFLANLMIPWFGGTTFLYSLIFFVVGALIIYFGGGPISKTEFFSLGLFFVVLAILFTKSLDYIDLDNFRVIDINFKNLFLPYGVILFSLGGMAVLPEIKEILKNQEKSMKNLVIIGTLIPAITYLLFIITVYGVTGQNTTEEGMIGLNSALGNGVVQLGFLFGIITTFTSFLTLGVTLKKEFHYDWNLPHLLSWAIACLPVLILFIIGLKDFIGIISFIGSVTLGIDITIIMIIYLKLRQKSQRIPAYSVNVSKPWIIILTTVFLLGIVIEIINILV